MSSLRERVSASGDEGLTPEETQSATYTVTFDQDTVTLDLTLEELPGVVTTAIANPLVTEGDAMPVGSGPQELSITTWSLPSLIETSRSNP